MIHACLLISAWLCTYVADRNIIKLLTLADEYQTDQVKVLCQYYIGGQLSHYFINFYCFYTTTTGRPHLPLPEGNMNGQELDKDALIDKLILYLWACDQYELPTHRRWVKCLLVALPTCFTDVSKSRHYPSLPPLSRIELLETLCSKFDGSSK